MMPSKPTVPKKLRVPKWFVSSFTLDVCCLDDRPPFLDFYLWQEQREYSFPQIHFSALILGIVVWSIILYLFQRGPSRIQPPEPIAGVLGFIGRRTLEIYAIQLAGSVLLVKLVPGLAP